MAAVNGFKDILVYLSQQGCNLSATDHVSMKYLKYAQSVVHQLWAYLNKDFTANYQKFIVCGTLGNANIEVLCMFLSTYDSKCMYINGFFLHND